MTNTGEFGPDDAANLDRGVKIHTENWTEEDDPRPSYSVIAAVSEVTGTAPEELNPLYDVVDADALDGLLYRMGTGDDPPPEGRVQFRYEGCDVTMYADGRTVALLSDADAP